MHAVHEECDERSVYGRVIVYHRNNINLGIELMGVREI